MTFYPSADSTGVDPTRFCFRSSIGHYGITPDYVTLSADTVAAFFHIQYGAGQFYQGRIRPNGTRYDSTFIFTLRAKRTGNQGTASDTVFTVTPLGASSWAKPFVNCSSAPLLPRYAVAPANPIWVPSVEMFTMRPPSLMTFAAS